MRIKKYDEFLNEEICRKGLIGAIGGVALGLGGIGTGAAYYKDKQVEPTELTTSTKKEIPNNNILISGMNIVITKKEDSFIKKTLKYLKK